MEKYPKTRGPEGTFVVIRRDNGSFKIITLDDWAKFEVFYQIYKVSFTRGPLQKWIRSAEYHEKQTKTT
jgi:hypothetical protein